MQLEPWAFPPSVVIVARTPVVGASSGLWELTRADWAFFGRWALRNRQSVNRGAAAKDNMRKILFCFFYIKACKHFLIKQLDSFNSCIQCSHSVFKCNSCFGSWHPAAWGKLQIQPQKIFILSKKIWCDISRESSLWNKMKPSYQILLSVCMFDGVFWGNALLSS